MKNPYFSPTTVLSLSSKVIEVMREVTVEMGKDAWEQIRDPARLARRQWEAARRRPTEWAEEVNDWFITQPALIQWRERMARRLEERWGEAERRRFEILFGGTHRERQRLLRQMRNEWLEAAKDLGRDWRGRFEKRTENFFRKVGRNLDRQMQAVRAYSVLDLKPGATPEAIKERHRELSRKYHPDRPGGDLKKMQDVNEAYTVLMKQGFHLNRSPAD